MIHHIDLLIRSPNMVLDCLVEIHAKSIKIYRFGVRHQHTKPGIEEVHHIDFYMHSGSVYRVTVYEEDYGNFEKYLKDIKIIKKL